jgi:hypothetical protein
LDSSGKYNLPVLENNNTLFPRPEIGDNFGRHKNIFGIWCPNP